MPVNNRLINKEVNRVTEMAQISLRSLLQGLSLSLSLGSHDTLKKLKSSERSFQNTIAPFVVFSVAYTIHEGPKLGA